MSKKAHETALPKRRFPEFRDADAWEMPPLGELMDGVSRRNRDKKINRVFTNSAVSGIIDQRDFFDKDIATAGNTDNYTVIELGDYVYNPRISEFAPVGPTSRNKLGQGIVSPLYTVFRFRNSNHNEFYDYYFGSTHWQNSLRAIGNSGARHDRMGISLTQLRLVKVPYPSLAEQQKIADTLSSLDALLTAQTARLTALQAHKRGLMQDLFPAEGETVPKRRFLEFQDAEEWEVTTLGNIISRVITGPFGSMLHQTDYVAKGIPVVNPQNIVDGKIISISKTMILEETFKRLKKYALRVGDIVIARRGEMGRCAVVEENNENWLCGTGSFIIRMNPEKSNSNFVNLIVSSEASKQRLENSSIGATMNNLNQDILTDLPVTTPSTAEQQKIADCLSSLNNLIAAQSQKLETLKLHKKGLMQALFPAASEPAA
jgi:type I restriction enzyme, S subunit